MNKRILNLFLLLAILAVSCTEKVNLKLDSTYTRLVVDGFIRNDTQNYKVRITKSSDYFANVPSPPVTGATVTLFDGIKNYPLTDPGDSGIYKTSPDFCGVIGRDYRLNIHLQDAIAGKTDYSASCKMIGVTRLDSIKTVFKPDLGKNGFWQVKLYAQDPPGQKNYYLLNLYRKRLLGPDDYAPWKLWSDTIDKVVISDNEFFQGNYIHGLEVFFINNDREYETLHVGDSVMLELSAVTKEYFDFIDQVQQSGFNIPFFTGPPANVVGNIDNSGIGFFAAYSSSYAKARVKE